MENALDQAAAARLRANQLTMMSFAALHDWGYDAQANDDGSVTVGTDVNCGLTGRWYRGFETVRTMAELRNWAGY